MLGWQARFSHHLPALLQAHLQECSSLQELAAVACSSSSHPHAVDGKALLRILHPECSGEEQCRQGSADGELVPCAGAQPAAEADEALQAVDILELLQVAHRYSMLTCWGRDQADAGR